jgi:hypothetical protein
VFLDIKAGQSVNLRFLPPWSEEGLLFFESAQHYKFTETGEKRAWACLRSHADEECPICQMVEKAKELGDDRFKKIIRDHDVSYRWHAQVMPLPQEGKPVEQTYIIGLSKTTAAKVSDLLKIERDNRQALITDPDKGQAVNISRNDKSGLQTRYEVTGTGIRIPLNDVFPGWADAFLDVPKAVNLRVGTRERLLESIQETVGNNVFKALLGDQA